MRIWTALLAGTCAALVLTLVGVAMFSLISPIMIEREALYDLFLMAWAAMVVLCIVSGKPLGQWLAAVRLSTIALMTLCLLCLLSTQEPVMLATTTVLAALLALLSFALGRPGINRNPRK